MNNPFKNLFKFKTTTSTTESTYSDPLISDTYTVTGTSTATSKYIIKPSTILPIWGGRTVTPTTAPWPSPAGSGPSGAWERADFNTFEVLFGNLLSAMEDSNKEMAEFYTKRLIEYLIQRGWGEKTINMTIEALHESLRNIEYEDIDL